MRNQIDFARDGEIARLRLQEKLSLQDIGDIAGISRERVRQILVSHLGTTGKPAKPRNAWDYDLDRKAWKEMKLLTLSEIASKTGLSINQAQVRRKRLGLTPSHFREKDMSLGFLLCGGYSSWVRGRKMPCCELRLPISKFRPAADRSTGYSTYCNNCVRTYHRERMRAKILA